MKYKIYERIEFSAAHRLEDYQGKCNELHGHNYLVEIWVESDNLNEQGMVVDFTVLKNIVKRLDHKYLNEILPYKNPTVERIANSIKKEIESKYKVKARIRVWEDKDSYVEVI